MPADVAPIDLMPAFRRQKANDLNAMYRFDPEAAGNPFAGSMTLACEKVRHSICKGWIYLLSAQVAACACGCHDAHTREMLRDGRSVRMWPDAR